LGRIAKTWHILEYIDDEQLRRRVLVGLNKGETLHSMARAVSFGRQGRFADHGYEAQLNRASALSLVLNAMVVWNTRYFEQAQAKLEKLGQPVQESVWQHLSPILWEHIHLVGSYHFADIQFEGEFRPLREYEEIPSGGGEAGEQNLERTPSTEEIMDVEPDKANGAGSAVQLALLQESEEV
jgi:hypothetical protein